MLMFMDMDAIYHMSIASRNPKKTAIQQFCTATKSCMKRPSACVATTFFFLSRQTYRIQCPLSLLESVQMGQFDLLADNFAGRFNEMIVTYPNQPTISTWKISHLHTTWAPHKVGLKGWLPQFLSSISDLQKNAQTSSILAAHVNRVIGSQSYGRWLGIPITNPGPTCAAVLKNVPSRLLERWGHQCIDIFALVFVFLRS